MRWRGRKLKINTYSGPSRCCRTLLVSREGTVIPLAVTVMGAPFGYLGGGGRTLVAVHCISALKDLTCQKACTCNHLQHVGAWQALSLSLGLPAIDSWRALAAYNVAQNTL
jgi:hypothetical protein